MSEKLRTLYTVLRMSACFRLSNIKKNKLCTISVATTIRMRGRGRILCFDFFPTVQFCEIQAVEYSPLAFSRREMSQPGPSFYLLPINLQIYHIPRTASRSEYFTLNRS